MSTRVFVGNVSSRVTREQLTRAFSEVGQVVSVSIPVDRQTQEPRGFAFVEFRSAGEAARAIQALDGTSLDGRRLRLSEALERGKRPERNGSSKRVETESRSESGDPGRNDWDDSDRGFRERKESSDYAQKRRDRPRRGGRHGSDRRRGRGTRRVID